MNVTLTPGTFFALAKSYLKRRLWLEDIEHRLLGSEQGEDEELFLYSLSYPFLASEYVDGLVVLQRTDNLACKDTPIPARTWNINHPRESPSIGDNLSSS